MPAAIVWIIVGAIAGAATVAYWNELKAWATNALKLFLDGVIKSVESIGGAIVSFIKIGRKIYKEINVISKEYESQKFYTQTIEKKEINEKDIPPAMLEKMNNDEHEIKVLELQNQA